MISIIQAAGWPIWPLLLCSIAALAVIIERFASLRAAKIAPPKLLDEVLSLDEPVPQAVLEFKPRESLEAQLGEMGPLLAAIGADIDSRRDFNVHDFHCDWRVAIENALESDHVQLIHGESLGQLQLGKGDFEFDGANSAWRAPLGNRTWPSASASVPGAGAICGMRRRR